MPQLQGCRQANRWSLKHRRAWIATTADPRTQRAQASTTTGNGRASALRVQIVSHSDGRWSPGPHCAALVHRWRHRTCGVVLPSRLFVRQDPRAHLSVAQRRVCGHTSMGDVVSVACLHRRGRSFSARRIGGFVSKTSRRTGSGRYRNLGEMLGRRYFDGQCVCRRRDRTLIHLPRWRG